MQKGPGNKEEERLAVTTTGYGMEQLVTIAAISNGTGQAIASSVAVELEKKGIKDQIKAICYDTTASNSGTRNGSVALLEKELGRKLLHLPCRHHIMELILEAAFTKVFKEKSSGPEITIFKRFQKAWSNIDKGIEEKIMFIYFFIKNYLLKDRSSHSKENFQQMHRRE